MYRLQGCEKDETTDHDIHTPFLLQHKLVSHCSINRKRLSMSQTQDTVDTTAAGGGPVDVDRSLHPDYKKDSGT